MRRLTATVAAAVIAATLPACQSARSPEILWDTWGVPHIYADNEADLMYAWGWAQMHAHGDRLLEQFAIVRGRAAQYLGPSSVAMDEYVWTMGLPQLTQELAGAASDEDDFVEGMNAYAQANPDALDATLREVLPLTGDDVLGLALYDEYFNGQVVTPTAVAQLREEFLAGGSEPTPPDGSRGSNAWALAPQRTTTGSPILLANPHAPWPSYDEGRHLLWFEAELEGPDLDFYGVGLIGLPALTFGFNEHLGWTGTSAPTFDYVDAYELILDGDGYRFDGEQRPFDTEEVVISVRQDDGSLSDHAFTVRRSVHGPVVALADGSALALSIPLPDAETIQSPQLLDMMRAKDLQDFRSAIEDQALMALNLVYADAEGNIYYAMDGFVPDRPDADVDWAGTVPGDTSDTLWEGKLPFSAMPTSTNPTSGHLQNANEPPHYASWPTPMVFDAEPDWPAPDVWPRTQRSLALLTERDAYSPADVMEAKFDTRSGLADAVLDQVIDVGRQFGSPPAQEAVAVLEAWDRTFDADSVGALVFAFWAMQYQPDILGGARFPDQAYAVPFDPQDPLETPTGLADPGRAVEALEWAARAVPETFGSLQVPWGAFVNFQVGEMSIPAFGAPPEAFGVFSPNFAAPTPEGPLATVAGDSWVAVVSFEDPIRAWAIQPYGNATQAGSAHIEDQLGLYAAKELREVWHDRAAVEANLETAETIHLTP